ncbi:hypothetical protein [Bosea sp. Root381]|uniref:hypothetical protein n=1 Tax=Bosea sp. Root381 TaxID=1736524 RepID=UPI0012E33A7F|nr:hypothetical protein [Bosea sp. Root381]
MSLVTLAAGRIAFNKSDVMALAHREGRFAYRMCRTLAERRTQLSIWLRKAWAAAKREAADLRRQAEQAAANRDLLAAALPKLWPSSPPMAALLASGRRSKPSITGSTSTAPASPPCAQPSTASEPERWHPIMNCCPRPL